MIKEKQTIHFARSFFLVVILTSLCIFTIAYKTPASACICCPCVSCIKVTIECSERVCSCQSLVETPQTMYHIYEEFEAHQEFLLEVILQDHVLPALQKMARQFTVTSLQQLLIIGSFFDAKHQLESQALLQELQAQAHKDYHPSAGMCRFGTNTRGLAYADSIAVFHQTGLATRNIQRTLMTQGSIGGGDALDDSRSRLAQFRGTYCNPKDFGNALDLLCTGADITRHNKDINFTHNFYDQETIKFDVGVGATEPEEDILALSANLYGNRLLPSIPNVYLADIKGNVIEEGAEIYMKSRALTAKRSVAFNSFAAQVALKTSSGEGSFPYLVEILTEMGLPEDRINDMLKGEPSYNAQMEVLTKRLYQTPNFYADLYDKPVNVDRKDTAMQAISLMQKRDIYRSQLRSEANMAIWLETMVEGLQDYHANEADKLTEGKIILNTGL